MPARVVIVLKKGIGRYVRVNLVQDYCDVSLITHLDALEMTRDYGWVETVV